MQLVLGNLAEDGYTQVTNNEQQAQSSCVQRRFYEVHGCRFWASGIIAITAGILPGPKSPLPLQARTSNAATLIQRQEKT